MITLERPVNKVTQFKAYCFIDDYGFTEGKEYTVTTNSDGNYSIIDDDGIETLYETKEDLKQTFFI